MNCLLPLSVLRFWISEGLTQAESEFPGWNSQAQREFPRNLESMILSLRILSLRTDRTATVWTTIHGTGGL